MAQISKKGTELLMPRRSIKDLLARRGDLSTFLVHLTRGEGPNDQARALDAKSRLKGILNQRGIQAKSPFGVGTSIIRRNRSRLLDTQNCACFTETPLEHIEALLGEITTPHGTPRECQFQPYGVAFTKLLGRMTGINPILYIENRGRRNLRACVTKAIADAIERSSGGRLDPVLSLAPFLDALGAVGETQYEFSWEREWRHVGDYSLPEHFIVLAPEAEHVDVKGFLREEDQDRPIIDGTWSLEKIIANLAGFTPSQVDVF